MVPKLRFKRDDGTDYHEWKEKSLKKLLKPNDKIPVDTAKYRKITIGLHLRGVSFYETKREMADKRPFYLRKEGEIIIGKQNYFNGSVALITRKFNNTICSNAIMSFMPSSNDVIAQFLLLAISNNNFLKKREYIATGTGQQELSEKAFLNFKVLIPCLEEQSKIADFLSTVDEVIKESEAEVKNLELQKKVAMQKIFSQEARFKKDYGTEYPEWGKNILGNICIIRKGKQLDKKDVKENGFYYHLNGGIEPSNRTDLFNTEANTISISEGGNSCGFVRWNSEQFFSGGHNYTIREIKDNIAPLYLFQYLKNNQKLIMELRVGTGLPNIQLTPLLHLNVLIPCLEEQQKIADFFSVYDKAINYAKQELEHWKQLKKGLLQQMFV